MFDFLVLGEVKPEQMITYSTTSRTYQIDKVLAIQPRVRRRRQHQVANEGENHFPLPHLTNEGENVKINKYVI